MSRANICCCVQSTTGYMFIPVWSILLHIVSNVLGNPHPKLKYALANEMNYLYKMGIIWLR